MSLTSLQVCMDSSSSDWLQGTSHEDSPGMESSPSPLSPNDVLACSRPLSMERRLRPPHDQALKCPRCDSTHTKFCYYNNYSLTQPRYFCKTCRRYWTKGGTLRNIPVGGGCRKNKKPSPSNSNKKQNEIQSPVVSSSPSFSNTTDLQLSFPDHATHFSHIGSLFHQNNPNFLPIDFMESKLEGIVGNNNNSFDFLGSSANNNNSNNNNNVDHLHLGMVNNLGGGTIGHGLLMDHNFHANNLCPPFSSPPPSSSLLDNNGTGMDTCQRLMMPYGDVSDVHGAVDVKPSAKLLSLDWQQEQGKDSFGYLSGLGAWTSGVMNNYGPSSRNPLV